MKHPSSKTPSSESKTGIEVNRRTDQCVRNTRSHPEIDYATNPSPLNCSTDDSKDDNNNGTSPAAVTVSTSTNINTVTITAPPARNSSNTSTTSNRLTTLSTTSISTHSSRQNSPALSTIEPSDTISTPSRVRKVLKLEPTTLEEQLRLRRSAAPSPRFPRQPKRRRGDPFGGALYEEYGGDGNNDMKREESGSGSEDEVEIQVDPNSGDELVHVHGNLSANYEEGN